MFKKKRHKISWQQQRNGKEQKKERVSERDNVHSHNLA